jgi:hypothetical protein
MPATISTLYQGMDPTIYRLYGMARITASASRGQAAFV